MPERGRWARGTLVILLCSLGWICLLGLQHLQGRDGILNTLENRLIDLRFRLVGPVETDPDLIFVAIDEATLEAGQTGEGGRDQLTRLIRQIAQDGARVLALDVLLADAGDPAERLALAEALEQVPSIIPAAMRFDAQGTPTIIWPHADFRARAQVGLGNISVDDRGIPRYVPMVVHAEGAMQPSLPLLAAIAFTGAQARIVEDGVVLDARKVPLDAGANMPLRLIGPTGTVPTVRALDVLGGGAAQALQDKLVLLGYSAETIGDRFLTPFDESTPSAEIIASAISQLIGGATLRHDRQTRLWDVILSTTFAMLCLAVVIWLPLARAALVLPVLLVLYGAAATQAFASGILLSLALPIVMMLPPVLGLGALRLAEARQDAQASARGLAALRRFQSKVLADRLAQDPHYLTTPQSQELFIFFVDLTGFTALSQRLGPEETRILLQDFHNLAAKAVETRGGCVINYMGDGILAVFGLDAPRARASDAKASLAAAAELATAVGKITPADGGAPLACRVGVHVGPVLLSRLGADTHQQVTVSGDTVNLASRLMEVAKTHRAQIVASQAVVDFLQNSEAFGPSRRAKVAIRGRSGEVEVRMWGKSMQTSQKAAAP